LGELSWEIQVVVDGFLEDLVEFAWEGVLVVVENQELVEILVLDFLRVELRIQDLYVGEEIFV